MVKYKRALQIKAERQPTILEEMGLDYGNDHQLTAAEKKALQLINNLDTELAVDKIVATLATLEDLVKKNAQLIHDDVAAELASFHRHGINIRDPANLHFTYSLLDARYNELGSKGSAGQLARIKALSVREETVTGIIAQRSSILHPKLEDQLETEVRRVERFLTTSLQKCLPVVSGLLPMTMRVKGLEQGWEFTVKLQDSILLPYLCENDRKNHGSSGNEHRREVSAYNKALLNFNGLPLHDPAINYHNFKSDGFTRLVRTEKDNTDFLLVGGPLKKNLVEISLPNQSGLGGYFGLSVEFPFDYEYKLSDSYNQKTWNLRTGPRKGFLFKSPHWDKIVKLFPNNEGIINYEAFRKDRNTLGLSPSDLEYLFFENSGNPFYFFRSGQVLKYNKSLQKINIQQCDITGITADWQELADNAEPLFVFPEFNAAQVNLQDVPAIREILQAYANLPAAIVKKAEQAYIKAYLGEHTAVDLTKSEQELAEQLAGFKDTSQKVQNYLEQGLAPKLLTAGED